MGAAAGFAAAPSAFLDLAEQCADRDGFAVLGRDFRQHAGGGRRHLDRHLVGFQFDHRLVGGDGVAGVLEPFADGRLGDGFAEGGYADFSHDSFQPFIRHAQARPGHPA